MNFVFGYFLKRHIENAGVPRVRLPPPVCDGNGKLWMWELPSLPMGRWLAAWAQWGVTAGHSMLREEGKKISPGRAEVRNLVGRDTDSLKSEGEKITNKKKNRWCESSHSPAAPFQAPNPANCSQQPRQTPSNGSFGKPTPQSCFFCWGWHWMVWNIYWSLRVSCPGFVSSRLLVHPQPTWGGAEGETGLEVVQALLSNS